MEAPSSCHRCPKYGRRDVIHRGTFDRTVHAPPIGTCRTQLFIKGPRLECRSCQQVLNAAIPKVVLHCQYTESFARLVIDLRKGSKNGMQLICVPWTRIRILVDPPRQFTDLRSVFFSAGGVNAGPCRVTDLPCSYLFGCGLWMWVGHSAGISVPAGQSGSGVSGCPGGGSRRVLYGVPVAIAFDISS